jgi:hypothetical protein
MKFSLFSVVALASAAMAAPAVQVQAKVGKIEAAVQARQVGSVVGGLTETVTSGTITKSVTKKITGTKVTNSGGVVKVLTIAVDETLTHTSSISTFTQDYSRNTSY